MLLMKNYFELPSIFHLFYQEVKNHFGYSINNLCSDNALNVKGYLQSYCDAHGILHQNSCSSTPQQNGVAERKNRNLVGG